MNKPFKLIVGLGNPGPEHTHTRHNAGFWCIDNIAESNSVQFKPESKFQGDISRLSLNGNDYWLLKPTTFMNNSGRSVQAMMAFYKITPKELLVMHDEIDLPPGTVRFKTGGGHGGQNGLRDIIRSLGSNDFSRIRIGVGHPGDKHRVVGHVLGRPDADELHAIEHSIDRVMDSAALLLSGDVQKAMNELHTKQ